MVLRWLTRGGETREETKTEIPRTSFLTAEQEGIVEQEVAHVLAKIREIFPAGVVSIALPKQNPNFGG